MGEYNIFGYFGMIGLPMAPCTAFPADSKAAIFTQHSLRDPQLAAELLARIRAGKEVFLTWPLLRDLRESELGRVFNVIGDGGTATSSTFRARDEFLGREARHRRPALHLPEDPALDLALRAQRGARARRRGLWRSPFRPLYGRQGGPPQPARQQLRPAAAAGPVLNAIRRCFFDELGVRLTGPGGVALYPFGERQYVLYNMTDASAKVALRFAAEQPTRVWKERMHGKSLAVTDVTIGADEGPHGPPPRHEAEVALTLRPFEIALVESQ